MTAAFAVTVKRDNDGLPDSRESRLDHIVGTTVGPGYYAIVVDDDPSSPRRLYCDGLLDSVTNPPVPGRNMTDRVQDNFKIYADCNGNGTPDEAEIAANPNLDINPPDGVLDSCQGGQSYCPGDVDNGTWTGAKDGGVDISDLLYFLDGYENGLPEIADLDNGSGTGTPDGGVDINDLLFFLAHYEGGC